MIRRAKEDRELIAAAALLSLLALAFYSEHLFFGKIFAFRDTHTILLPLEHMVRALQVSDWLPLWVPGMVLGKPLFADPLSGLAYPPNWVLRLLPHPAGWHWSIALHHVTASIGIWLLLRQRGVRAAAALPATILFCFGGTLVATDNMINALQSAAWLPWSAYFFERLNSTGERRWFALTAGAFALTFLGGMPEVILFENLLLAALCAEYKLTGRTGIRRSALRLAFINLFWIGLSAFFLLPFVEYFLHSARSAGLETVTAARFSFPPLRSAGFLHPETYKGFFRGCTAAAGHDNWAVTTYLGPLLFAALAAARGASLRIAALWGIFFLTILLLCFGAYVPGYRALIEIFPALRIARYPEKFLVLLHFLVCVAAGIGLERCAAQANTARLTAHVIFWASVIGYFVWLLPCSAEAVQIPALLGVAIAGAVYCFSGGHKRAASAVVTIATAAGLFWGTRNVLPLASWNALAAQPVIAGVLGEDKERVRLYANTFNLPSGIDGEKALRDLRELPYRGMALLWELNNINNPASINLADHIELIKSFEQADRGCAVRMLAAFNVAYVSSYRDLSHYPGLERVTVQDGSQRLPFFYRVPGVFPRIYVAETVLKQEHALNQLCTAPPGKPIAIVESPGIQLARKGTISRQQFKADSIAFTAELEAPGVVVINDTYFPGWKAFASGQEIEIIRVNQFVRGIVLPQGQHDIRLEYAPRPFMAGIIISMLSSVLLLCYLLLPAAWLRL